MKKGWGVWMVLMVMAIGAMAQEGTPRGERRQHQQLTRIRHGLANGDLSRREAYRLLMQERNIRRSARMARADGHISHREQRHLHRMHARTGRHIYFQRHDRQSRLN